MRRLLDLRAEQDHEHPPPAHEGRGFGKTLDEEYRGGERRQQGQRRIRPVGPQIPARPVDGEEPRTPHERQVGETEQEDADDAELKQDVDPHAVRLRDLPAVEHDPVLERGIPRQPGRGEAAAEGEVIARAFEDSGPDRFAVEKVSRAVERGEHGNPPPPECERASSADDGIADVVARALAGLSSGPHQQHGRQHERDPGGGDPRGHGCREHERQGRESDPHAEHDPARLSRGEFDREHDDREQSDHAEEVRVPDDAVDARAGEDTAADPLGAAGRGIRLEPRVQGAADEPRHQHLGDKRETDHPSEGGPDRANDLAPGEHARDGDSLEGRGNQQQPRERGCLAPARPRDGQPGPQDQRSRNPGEPSPLERWADDRDHDRRTGDDHAADDRREGHAESEHPARSGEREEEAEDHPSAQQKMPGALPLWSDRRRRSWMTAEAGHGALRVALSVCPMRGPLARMLALASVRWSRAGPAYEHAPRLRLGVHHSDRRAGGADSDRCARG